MKKILFLSVLLAYSLSYSQRTKREDGTEEEQERKITSTGYLEKDLIFSGGVGYFSESTGNVKTSGFSLNPKLGLFLSDKFVLGIGLNYASNNNENPLFGINEESSFGGGLFARLYLHPEKDFSFFFQLDANYDSVKQSFEIGGVKNENNATRFNLGLSPAASYFLSQNVAIEASFGNLGYTSTKPDNGDSTSKLGIGFDLSTLRLGLTLKL